MRYHRAMKRAKDPAAVKAAAALIGRRGGMANTKAQNRARARNAQKAGRPRRVCKTCRQPVLGGHVDRALDETCGQHGWQWEQAGKRHPAPPSALDAIAAVLVERHSQARSIEWALGRIADIVTASGREVK